MKKIAHPLLKAGFGKPPTKPWMKFDRRYRYRSSSLNISTSRAAISKSFSHSRSVHSGSALQVLHDPILYAQNSSATTCRIFRYVRSHALTDCHKQPQKCYHSFEGVMLTASGSMSGAEFGVTISGFVPFQRTAYFSRISSRPYQILRAHPWHRLHVPRGIRSDIALDVRLRTWAAKCSFGWALMNSGVHRIMWESARASLSETPPANLMLVLRKAVPEAPMTPARQIARREPSRHCICGPG